MTAACSHGVTAEHWIDFFASELDEEPERRLEQRMFECADCAAEASRWAAIAGGASIVIPTVISSEALRALQDRGEPMTENPMQPGEHSEAHFPDGGRLLIHRLEGLEFGPSDHVNLSLSTPEGTPLVRFEEVPFDRAAGEVIVACQRHFGESFPRVIVFEVERRIADQVEVLARYSVDHVSWA